MLNRAVLAAVLLLLSIPAWAQVYAWTDPGTSAKKLSNLVPPWYSRREEVSGPRVVVTLGGAVIDDTALEYQQRLRLFGPPQNAAEPPLPPPNPPIAKQEAGASTDAVGAKPRPENPKTELATAGAPNPGLR